MYLLSRLLSLLPLSLAVTTRACKKKLKFICGVDALIGSATTFIENNPQARLRQTTDASDAGVGAVVEQESNAQCKPIAFFSAKLSPTQSNYSTFFKELLAIYVAIKQFRHHLESRHFMIFTDHKPLTNGHAEQFRQIYSSRTQTQLQFTTDLRYVKGENNTVADTLSRT